ncbi:MAG: helix-turn-helix domain-containing protein [Gallionella sp.]
MHIKNFANRSLLTNKTMAVATSDTIMDSFAENSLETIARNLSAARVGMALSQDQLAELAGVSRATIVQLEGGEGDPRLSTLVGIAGALSISPLFLLLGKSELKAIANVANSREAARIQEHLSEESLEDMERLLRSGLPKNRNKAVALGTGAATAAGFAAGAVAGSAIGSALLPGIGTIIGGVLGSWLYHNKPDKNDND